MELKIDIEGIYELSKEFKEVSKNLTNVDARREVAQAAVPYVIPAIQNASPVGKRIHKRYNTPKLTKKLRSPKGYGRVIATYYPGNLRKSVLDLATRKSKFKKSPVVVVAPYYGRRGSKGDFGKGKRVDAYYAHMVYGGAEAYQQKVLLKGLNIAATVAIPAMKRKFEELLKVEKQRTGL